MVFNYFAEIRFSIFFLVVLGFLPRAEATTLAVSINTAFLNGTHSDLVFDLISGDGSILNTVSEFGFSSDAIVTNGLQSVGSVTGNIISGIQLQNTQFFNEADQPFTLGNTLNFSINLTENFDSNATTPDSLSVFFLDTNQANLFLTTDPSGSNSLFKFDITGFPSGDLNVYQIEDSVSQITWTVQNESAISLPLPNPFWLFGLCLIYLFRAMRYKENWL